MTQEIVRLPQVPVRTLHEHALETIRRAIIFGQLPAGHHLKEEEIADQMGISRAPVREAFRLLEQEGLVVSYPHRGKVVATISDEELSLLYMVRADLEGFALRSILQQGTTELLAELQQSYDRMRQATDGQDLLASLEEDQRFHSLIVSRSGHPTLHRVWTSLDGPSRTRAFAMASAFRDRAARTALGGHQRIIDAIASGDSERSVETLQKHILENLDWATLARLGVFDLSACRFLSQQAIG